MKISVLIPCYNEEKTIEKVINDFRKELKDSYIYVYDNNSIDKTYDIVYNIAQIDKRVFIKKEPYQGKGNVLRRMFQDIDSDIYILVDGDDTYPAEFVHKMIEPIIKKEADMVIGDRLSNGSYIKENKRIFHDFGNKLVIYLINKLFKANLKDIMSGYRVFNKEFVKNMSILSNGFEVETEITISSLDKKFILKEIPIKYRNRPEGSYSKLNTFSDGIKVLKTICCLFKDYKPLMFFSIFSLIFFMLSLFIGLPVIYEFIETNYVTKIPSAILAVGLMLISIISLFSGFILDTIIKHQKENYEINIKHFNG